jgi:hypothetical protein
MGEKMMRVGVGLGFVMITMLLVALNSVDHGVSLFDSMLYWHLLTAVSFVCIVCLFGGLAIELWRVPKSQREDEVLRRRYR